MPATVALLAGSALTVSTNGLHNTAVAEYAGPGWAGRALGVHGTGQHAAVVVVPPLAGAVIAAHGYGWVFAGALLFPLPAAGALFRWPDPTAWRPARGSAAVGTADVGTAAVSAAGPPAG